MNDWKSFANWWKLIVAVEITAAWFIMTFLKIQFGFFDLIGIGLFQYGLFFPVDMSILIKNIKGTVN